MLLNTTIQALVASTTAATAHVIARLVVRAASPAVFAGVLKRGRSGHQMRWCYCLEHEPTCSLSDFGSDDARTPSRSSRDSRNCFNGTGSGRS